MSYKDYEQKIANLEEEIERLKACFNTAYKIMEYYDLNKGIHPMLEDYATQWLEVLKGSKGTK